MERTATSQTYILRKARLDAGLTQQQLAGPAGLSLKKLVRLENDEQVEWKRNTVRTLMALARVLDIPCTTLVPGLAESGYDERT